jgi:hypothetical protein
MRDNGSHRLCEAATDLQIRDSTRDLHRRLHHTGGVKIARRVESRFQALSYPGTPKSLADAPGLREESAVGAEEYDAAPRTAIADSLALDGSRWRSSARAKNRQDQRGCLVLRPAPDR